MTRISPPEQFDRIELRLAELSTAIDHQTVAMTAMLDILHKIVEAVNRPSDGRLQETLERMIGVLQGLTARITDVHHTVDRIEEAIE